MIRRLRGLAVRGSGARCACCGAQYRRFLSFGDPVRANAQCPHCGSLERHRLLWLYLEHVKHIASSDVRLLHFAPEPAIGARLDALKRIDHVTADLNDDDVDVRCDIESIPFADGAFDALICYHVLEHVSDDRRALSELYRVVRAGAWAMISVPFNPRSDLTDEDSSVTTSSERRSRFGQEDHLRLYGNDYVDRFRSAGFSVETLPVQDLFSTDVLLENGIHRDEVIVVCSR